jgi:large conductance mechanosensitive channel
MLREFRQFLFRGNIVDLAIAVILGAALGALVTSLVTNLFTPIIAAIVGKPDFSDLTFTINGSVFRYGAFINALIAFVSIATVVFFLIVKPVSAMQDRLGIAKDDEVQPSDEAKLLAQIRDELREARGA